MSKNSLSVGIPRRLFNSSYIRALDIRYNQFISNLDCIPFLSQIKLLMLGGGNKFEGQISESLCHLHHLNILDLSHNIFSGPLAPCIGGISLGSHANNIDLWSAATLLYFMKCGVMIRWKMIQIQKRYIITSMTSKASLSLLKGVFTHMTSSSSISCLASTYAETCCWERFLGRLEI
jgi:hypothetical protein